MRICDIMRPGAFTIRESDTIGAAQRAMSRASIRHLPVMSADKLVGMLSERDVLRARACADADEEWWAIPVREVMKTPPHFARPEDSLTEVAGRLSIEKIGAMPVVDKGKLLGIATITDVLDAEVREAMGQPLAPVATAAEAMTPYPITVQPQTLLVDAAAIMTDRHVRHLPVVDTKSTIVGMLSERDVRSAIGDPANYLAQRGTELTQLRVQDVMTRPAVVVRFDAPVPELARRFADEKIGALPVVDKFDALIGIISYVDALRVLAAERA